MVNPDNDGVGPTDVVSIQRDVWTLSVNPTACTILALSNGKWDTIHGDAD